MDAWRSLSSIAAASALFLLLGLPPVGCGPIAEPPSAPPSAPASASAPPALSASAAAEPIAHEPAKASDRFAVAAENETAARIAMDVLERGGSAADAAVAGVLAVGVTQPVSSGLGGGGFALVFDAATKKVTALDFREIAPIGIRPNEFFKRPPPEKKRGVMTGVPGELAGLAELHKRWGKLAWSDVTRGAIDAAEKGFVVSEHLGRALSWNETWVRKTPRYAFWLTGGALLQKGATTKNPALAATLRRIASEGPSALYAGAIASDILDTARAAGSRMIAADLAAYRVVTREPLRTTWEGHEVFTMPPPSAGGVMMLETLHMHTKADLVALGDDTTAYRHLLAETFRGAIADRIRVIGDPAFVNMDVAALVAKPRMKKRRARISLERTRRAEKFQQDEAGTSHLVAVDGEGNVVSITSTVNNMFGAKLVTAGGFVLNDELDDFTKIQLDERFGVSRSPNAPRGRARPVSSMTPTIVVRDGEVELALGGSGGTRIATAVTQVLLAQLAFDRSASEAVSARRIETPLTGGLLVERGTPESEILDLKKRGEVVDATKPNFSAVQSIAISRSGGVRTLDAAADPRKGGAAIVK